jgi:hypothetical protein
MLFPLSRLERKKSDNGRFAAAFDRAYPSRHTAAQEAHRPNRITKERPWQA